MKCIGLLLVLAACKSGSPPKAVDYGGDVHTTLADETDPAPPYDTAALQMALIAERAAEAKNEHLVEEAETGEADRLRVALADLAVRRRYIRILEVCQAQKRLCPPRLDEPVWPYLSDSDADPKLDVPLRFDLTSWQKVTTELHGRACACRTLACIDSMDATIGRLESRPTDQVQADDTAVMELTQARECLLRLRGKRAMPKLATDL